MALTPLQTNLKNYLTTGAASTVHVTGRDGLTLRTVAEWFALNDAELLLSVVNSPAVGSQLGLSLPQTGLVSNAEVRKKLFASPNFATFPDAALARLDFALNGMDFNFGDAELVTAVQGVLEAYPDQLTAFNGLLTRFVSINEKLFDGAVTEAELGAAFAG